MNIMKKIKSVMIITIVAMLVGGILPTTNITKASSVAIFAIDQKIVDKGTTSVSLDVKLSSLPSGAGLVAFDYSISFEPSELVYIGSSSDFTSGTILTSGIMQTPNLANAESGTILVGGTGTAPVYSTGKIATLKFKPVDGFVGSSTVRISVTGCTVLESGASTETTIPTSVSAQGKVTVQEVDITSVALNKSSMTLVKGGTSALTATISPSNATVDKTLTWTSSDSSVATVSSAGVVTGIKEGTATITATTTGGKSTSCMVTVIQQSSSTTTQPATTDTTTQENEVIKNEEEVEKEEEKEKEEDVEDKELEEMEEEEEVEELKPIEIVKFESSKLEMNKKYNLEVIINAEEFMENVLIKFMSSDESIVTISEDGTITPIGEGFATLTAYINDEIFDTYEIEVVEEVIEDVEEEEEEKSSVAGTVVATVGTGAGISGASVFGIRKFKLKRLKAKN